MIDWVSLIPAGVSLLSGMFGNNSSKNKNDSAIDKATGKILTEAGKVYSRPYQAYTGQRVAGFGSGRNAATPWMQKIGDTIQGQMNDSSGLMARARELMGLGPQRISVPTMVNGGPQVGMNPAPSVTPMPSPPTPSPFTMPSLSAPTLPAGIPYAPPTS